MKEVKRLLIGIATGWIIAFCAVATIWNYHESIDCGQQYPDPLLPVVYCAWVLGSPFGLISGMMWNISSYWRGK